tara:strand:+ start:1043 stop:1165 length:123 start_codon:yes stop_codon:yes gene_type:complete
VGTSWVKPRTAGASDRRGERASQGALGGATSFAGAPFEAQ